MSAGEGDRVTEAQVRRELMRMDDRAARRHGAVGALVILAAALVLGSMIANQLFALVSVRGDGMAGTIQSGDAVLCVRSEAPALTRPLARGDIALVRYAVNGLHRETLRRVIALPGDVVSVDGDGAVTLNGEPLDEPYAAYRSGVDWNGGEVVPGGALENPFDPAPQTAAAPSAQAGSHADDLGDEEYPIVVPEGKLFVLCDNRDNLLDSRSSRFSLVSEGNVLGLARAILWPAWRIRLPGCE